MFHVKQMTRKAFDFQTIKFGYIKCFTVKVKLQHFVKQKQIKPQETENIYVNTEQKSR